MKTTLIIIAMMVATFVGSMSLQALDQANATRSTKLIDTSTGEVRAGTVGEPAPAGTLAGVTLPDRRAPPVMTGDNVYVAWWANSTGNDEVMFRASSDGGTTFTDKINLSNSTNADSQDVEIAAYGDSVVVTWWERNQTAEEPVAKVSSDAGATFRPLLRLASNGTIGQASEVE
jgi:hypothetical protein